MNLRWNVGKELKKLDPRKKAKGHRVFINVQ